MRCYAVPCRAMRGYAGLCGAMRGRGYDVHSQCSYAGLCGAMRCYAVLCGAMRAGENSCPPTACNDVPFMDPSLIISYFQ